MKRKFKAVAVLLVVMMMATLLAGCGGGDKKEEGAAKGEQVTIRFSHWRGEDSEIFNKLIQKFQTENPNIKVEMSVTGSEAYIASSQAELQSSKGPDVFTTFPGSHFETLSKAGVYSDLTNQAFVKNFNPNLIIAGQKDGKQLAVPYQLVYNLPVYNKALFEKYNLEVPKDWDSFLAACETFKKNGITPILIAAGDNSPGQFINTMLMNNQPDEKFWEKVLAGELKFTDDWYVKTLSDIKTLQDKGYFQEGALGSKKEGTVALFAQEKGAMLAQGSYMMSTVSKQNPNLKQGLLGIITTPADKAVYEGIHTTTFMMGINVKSKHQAEAAKFIEFLTRPEIAAEYANGTGQMLTVNGVQYDSPELKEQATWLDKKTRFQPRFTITSPEIMKAVEVSLQDVIGGMDPKQAAAKVQEAVEKVKAEKK